MNSNKELEQKINSIVIKNEVRIKELDQKLHELTNTKAVQNDGEVTKSIIKEYSDLKNEKAYLEDVVKGFQITLKVLYLLRPIDNNTQAHLEKRATDIDKFMDTEDIPEVYRPYLSKLRNELMTGSKWSARETWPKAKVLPWS